jgi:hypothetical protein
MLNKNKKTKECICIIWKEDHVKEKQENHNSQEHQDQGSEEGKLSRDG